MILLRRAFGILWEIVETTTFVLGFVVVTYFFLFQTGEVHGASSFPTWKDNERFITDKISYRIGQPQRGDFIVLQSPKNAEVDFIKRIIGLPEERLKINGGKVYINGTLLYEPYLQPETFTGPEGYLKENKEIIIPKKSYFVMGDNRQNSSDSRDFGPIRENSIVGKVTLRFWPPEKFGIIN